MSTTSSPAALIYTGSVEELRGRPVLARERCHCSECADLMFRCQQCGGGAEYTWLSCPHPAPEARLTLVVLDERERMVRLAHARPSSVTQAPSIALVPSGRYPHLATAICRACLWSTAGYCDPQALAADVEEHRARCTGAGPAGQTAGRADLNRLTLEHFDRTGQGWG